MLKLNKNKNIVLQHSLWLSVHNIKKYFVFVTMDALRTIVFHNYGCMKKCCLHNYGCDKKLFHNYECNKKCCFHTHEYIKYIYPLLHLCISSTPAKMINAPSVIYIIFNAFPHS